MLENIANIIKNKIQELNMKAESLALEVGITESYISKIVNNKLKTPPSEETLIKIATILKLSEAEKHELLRYAALSKTPEIVREEFETLKKALENSKELSLLETPTIKMPIYSGVSAGNGVLCYGEIIGYNYFPQMKNMDNKFNIKVYGDSMEPMIPDGAIVTINKQPNLENGEIGVFIINGDNGFVKKFYLEDKFIRLASLNPNYKDKIILLDEEIHIVGKVIKVSYDL